MSTIARRSRSERFGSDPCTVCGLKKIRLPAGTASGTWADTSKCRVSVNSGPSRPCPVRPGSMPRRWLPRITRKQPFASEASSSAIIAFGSRSTSGVKCAQ